ncbi:MAG: hypothetical protein ABEL76_09235, partial [Bradymonadaceae bacterium]
MIRRAAVLSSAAAVLAVGLLPSTAFADGGDDSIECDSQFNDCGTPEKSGGGGGNSSVLIAGTDLGESYQFADDYDDDGIGDGNDNCRRAPNLAQVDGDG